MANEGFLQRWSRLKAAPEAAELPVPSASATPAHPGRTTLPAAGAGCAETETAPAAPLPTLADAAMLNADSDYAAFVARGVDPDVRRLAMKKLFGDPHFNRIDGLDIYMSDYNIPSPVSPAMLASLSHARSVFARIDELLDPALADDAAPAIITASPPADTTDTADTTVAQAPPPDQDAA